MELDLSKTITDRVAVIKLVSSWNSLLILFLYIQCYDHQNYLTVTPFFVYLVSKIQIIHEILE